MGFQLSVYVIVEPIFVNLVFIFDGVVSSEALAGHLLFIAFNKLFVELSVVVKPLFSIV